MFYQGQGWPKDQQDLFVDAIANDYRDLADLLLQQDRVLEAQQILDLLKVQELDDYLRNVRSGSPSQPDLAFFDPETQISNQAIFIGHQLVTLKAIPYAQRSETDNQRIAGLREAQRAIIKLRNSARCPHQRSIATLNEL